MATSEETERIVPVMVRVNDPWESKYRPADNDPANTAKDDTDDIHLHVSQHLRRKEGHTLRPISYDPSVDDLGNIPVKFRMK